MQIYFGESKLHSSNTWVIWNHHFYAKKHTKQLFLRKNN